VFTGDEWQRFCEVIGNPGLAGDSRFSTLLSRKKNEEELDLIINEWTKDRTAEEVMDLMQAAGVAAGVVETVEDQVLHEPHLKEREFFWELESPETKRYVTKGAPFYRLSVRVRQGPLLGEHNNYILKDILGLSDEEITDLQKEGVIG
jgi:crotonobetainyl-CoA:carnitine CoA-transferase CaiB-like acyl-CoA transferase